MRVWLDDVRPMPHDFDIHVKTAKDAIKVIIDNRVTFISFDHDLGEPENGTGYDVAAYIEMLVHDGVLDYIPYGVHSANPVGAQNIRMAMSRAYKYQIDRI